MEASRLLALAAALAVACSLNLAFVAPAPAPRVISSLTSEVALRGTSAALRGEAVAESFGLGASTPAFAAGGQPFRVAAVLAISASLLLGSRRAPAVARQARGRIPVRQWAPEKIPCSERRAPEDRIRIKMFAHETMSLLEATETLQDFAMETGGEVEGPMVQAKKKLHMYLNKSPKGHKKTAKYHMNIEEHCWIMDYYPPAEGGLEAIMKIRLPHTVMVKIE
jgi:ribosomal protein S10